MMQRVQIDYRQLDVETLWQSLQSRWLMQLRSWVISWALLQLVFWPFLLWFMLDHHWILLAALEVLLLVAAVSYSRNSTRQDSKILRRIPPLQLTLRPEGLEAECENFSHRLHGWRKFHHVQRSPLGLMMVYRDHAQVRCYVIPNSCFATAAEAEAFATAATQAIAAQATAPPVAESKLLSVPPREQYRLRYQLTRAELYTDDAKAKLHWLHSDTLANAPAGKPILVWQRIAFVVFTLALVGIESFLIPVEFNTVHMVFLLFGFVYVIFIGLFYPRVMAWIRTVRSTPVPPVEVWLNDDGIFRTTPDELLQIPWSGVDAMQVHERRMILWKHDWCRLIIPQRVFDTAEQAHECERWIEGILYKQFNPLPVAELAQPESAITVIDPRPASP